MKNTKHSLKLKIQSLFVIWIKDSKLFLLYLLIYGLSVLFFSGCGGSIKNVPPEIISLTSPLKADDSNNNTITVGFSGTGSITVTLTLNYKDENGDKVIVSWATDNDACKISSSNGTSENEGENTNFIITENTGVCTITVTLNDGINSAVVSSIKIEITSSAINQPPTIVSANCTPTIIALNNNINCEVNATDAVGDTLTYYWTFGDGTSSSEQNPSHSYNSLGDYTINLTVIDNKGASTDADSIPIEVTDKGGIIISW